LLSQCICRDRPFWSRRHFIFEVLCKPRTVKHVHRVSLNLERMTYIARRITGSENMHSDTEGLRNLNGNPQILITRDKHSIGNCAIPCQID